jgi:LPXTG-site transpeptidase (sortase) family protein
MHMMRTRMVIIGVISVFIGMVLFFESTLLSSATGEPRTVAVIDTTEPNVSRLSDSFMPILSENYVGIPTTLKIPKIHVDAPVEVVGLTKSGAMDAPKAWENVGWYGLGPRPGEQGNSVVAGHLDSDTGLAVFWQLRDLKPGDTIEVTDDAGKTFTFRVTHSQKYEEGNVPMQEIFGPTTGTHLNLITCGGKWDAKAQKYISRLVVFTELVTAP